MDLLGFLTLDYLSKLAIMCKELAQITTQSKFYHFCDYTSAFLLHGCSLNQYSSGKFYALKEFERRQTVTFRRSFKIWKLFHDPSYIHYFENKVDFNRRFEKYVSRDWVYSKEGSDAIREFLSHHDRFMLKPIDALQGKGVKCLNTKELNIEDFILQVKNENVLLEEYIKQHPKMVLENKSVNTIRVFTLLDKDGNVHILKTVLRAGKGDCIIDNFCAGGCLYAVDVKSGVVEERGIDQLGQRFLFHPGTEICMLGFQIPNWEQPSKTVIEAAKVVPQCRYIGWDVAILENGVSLIEGNHNPDHDLLEFVGYEKMFWKRIMQYK